MSKKPKKSKPAKKSKSSPKKPSKAESRLRMIEGALVMLRDRDSYLSLNLDNIVVKMKDIRNDKGWMAINDRLANIERSIGGIRQLGAAVSELVSGKFK